MMSAAITIRSQVLRLILIVCYADTFLTSTMAYTFRRHNTKLTLKPDADSGTDLDSLSSSFLKRLDNDIKTLSDSKQTLPIELHRTQTSDTISDKKRYTQAPNHYLIDIYSVMKNPTNRRRVLLKSKSGLMLKMNDSGQLRGTPDSRDPAAVFIIESMAAGVVRLKGEKARKYICIGRSGKLVFREKPLPKCLLYKYMEENLHDLFWSYKYSTNTTGQSGWFLALRKNGKTRKPAKTRLGTDETMFYVHYLDPL